jgi:hypothetical protein
MKNETENLRQAILSEAKEQRQDLMASLLDPQTDIPLRIPSATLIINGITDILIETAGNARLIPTEEIAEVEVARGSDRLKITRREIPEDPKTLQTSTYSLRNSIREWVYSEDVPTLSFPENTVYNIPIPTTDIWKVTSSIATRGEIVLH